jgi:hypothetical protein
MSCVNGLTALSYNIEAIGKLFSDSKTRHTWTMDIDGETQVIVVTASWNSGKFVVELNGYERFHQTINGVFLYSFKFRDRFFKIQQLGDQLNLSIDTVPFSQYSAKAKTAQAAMLKAYESQAKPKSGTISREHSPKSNKSSSPEPFSGNLAKRLGKKDEYIPQNDEEEDFFSAPVKVQSFVTATPVEPESLTVIPNLIELSEAPAKPVPRVPIVPGKVVLPVQAIAVNITPATGPVTPRDQISPSKLQNPFAAFDELAVENEPVQKPSQPLLEEDSNPFR